VANSRIVDSEGNATKKIEKEKKRKKSVTTQEKIKNKRMT